AQTCSPGRVATPWRPPPVNRRCRPRPGSHLRLGPDRLGDEGDRLLDGDAVALAAVAVTEGDGAGVGVLSPGDEDEGDLRLRGGADLLIEAVVARVDLDPDAGGAQLGRDAVEVVGEDVR